MIIQNSKADLQSKNQYTVESHAERGKSKPDEVKPHTFSWFSESKKAQQTIIIEESW